MKTRNEQNVYKGTTRKGILKCIKDILCFNVMLCCAIPIIIFVFENTLVNGSCSEIVIPIVVFYLIFMDFVYFIVRVPIYVELEKNKINKKITEDILPIDRYVKVFPNKGYLKYKKFFEVELPQIADYFAVQQVNKDKISVFVKFHSNDKYFFLEFVSKEDFIKGYYLVDSKES